MTAYLRDFDFTLVSVNPAVTVNNLSFHCLSPKYAKIYFDISLTNLAVTNGSNDMQIGIITTPTFTNFEGSWHFVNNSLSYKVSILNSTLYLSIISDMTTVLAESIKGDDTLIITSGIENAIPSYGIMW